jgi:hypothetical protein
MSPQRSPIVNPVHWFEVLRATDAPMPVPTNKAIEQIQKRLPVTLHTTVGEPFWASTEIVCIADMVERTAALLTTEAIHG